MKRIVLPAAIILATTMAATAHAQDVERYSLEKTDDGYVRMDTRTGEMSVCKEQSGQLVCRLAADETAAYAEEMDRLSNRVDSLEDRLAALEAGQGEDAAPSDEEFDRTLGRMERFFRKFLGIAREFDRELGDDDAQDGGDTPDRT